MYYAHSKNAAGKRQNLDEHLRNVAGDASRFAEPFGASALAETLGFCHDFGKFTPGFQDYLRDCEEQPRRHGRGPDHKAAGTRWVLDQRLSLLALLVQGHHGGLKEPAEMQRWLADKLKDGMAYTALAAAREALPDFFAKPVPAFPDFVLHDQCAAEFFFRMLFSALVDADFLDTERHFNADKTAVRGVDVSIAELWERFEKDQAGLRSTCSATVGEARADIYAACLQSAADPSGFFRLTVPTGGGKTRSGMAFALRHAMEHQQHRIIVAVPYISITEQTAATYRAIFNDQSEERPIVLEHHSGVAGRDDDTGDAHPNAVWSRLAAENWDAPVIVTTTVQLFESLFANGTSKCRKLHRLAKSVIILDEAQALPPGLLAPILDGLKELCAHYGTTVVISTATQPAFEAIPAFGEVAKGAPEIVPDPVRYFALLRRVIYDWRIERPLAWDDVAAIMREERQALAIVNTKKDALALLDALGPESGALHLSTLLCGRHRQRVIEEVRRRLDPKVNEPCLLVSTQVVEAGVDLDFPLVLRALGPLDSIIQAAGRCNRGGNLPHGRVIIFRPEEERTPPGDYAKATANTQTWRNQGDRDPDSPNDVRDYFRQFYGMTNADAKGIQPLREKFNYPEVAATFSMIDDETESVVIRDYGSDEERHKIAGWIEQLRYGVPYARTLLRRLQPYTVAVRVREAKRYREQGLIVGVTDSVGEWYGKYDPTRGLTGDATIPDKLVF